MVAFSSLLVAAGLTGLSCAAPATRATAEGTFVPSIGYGTNPPGFVATAVKGTKPKITQFTPEEFSAWIANTTTVTTVPAGSGTTAEKRSVIGNDDRYYQASSDFPFGAMGRLYMPLGNGYYAWCSGTLVGPRLLASARHCIIDDAQYFQFSPGYNEGDRFPTAFATEIISLVPDSSIGNCDLKNDWALYVLDQAIGVQRGWLWPGEYSATDGAVVNQPVLFSSGYPGDLDGGQRLYMSDSRTTSLGLQSSCANGGPIIGDCDVAGGMSGGPLWRRVGDGRWVYGTLFGAFIDGNGNELSSIHSNGADFVNAVNELNSQFPA